MFELTSKHEVIIVKGRRGLEHEEHHETAQHLPLLHETKFAHCFVHFHLGIHSLFWIVFNLNNLFLSTAN